MKETVTKGMKVVEEEAKKIEKSIERILFAVGAIVGSTETVVIKLAEQLAMQSVGGRLGNGETESEYARRLRQEFEEVPERPKDRL